MPALPSHHAAKSTSPACHPETMPRALATTSTLNQMRGHIRSLLAKFGLTPKSRRGLAYSDPGRRWFRSIWAGWRSWMSRD